MDRWYGLTLGIPFMIDVHDCDARLPGPELTIGHPPLSTSEVEYATSLAFMGELVKLSVLLGKVTRTIYRCVLDRIPLQARRPILPCKKI